MKVIIQLNSNELQRDCADVIETPILVRDEDYQTAINRVIENLKHCDFEFSDEDEDSSPSEFTMYRDGDIESLEYVTVVTYNYSNI